MSRRIAHKVLLVGWEAADWQMLRPLVDGGLMPALAKLIADGASGNLATIQPALSPMLWTSIATGKRADKHGICGLVEPTADHTGLRPASSTSRSCKAVWNILCQVGMTSRVVGWPSSHPAEPIRGTVVSDRFVNSLRDANEELSFAPQTFHPSSLEQEIGPLCVRPSDVQMDAILPFVPQLEQIEWKNDQRIHDLVRLMARTSSVHAAACHQIVQQHWDFQAVYYSAIEDFSRCFGPFFEKHSDADPPGDAIDRNILVGCYQFLDMMLEALLSFAGTDTTVLLVSDHGSPRGIHQSGFVSSQSHDLPQYGFGIACAKGPGILRGTQLTGATVLDVTPTILTMLGMAVGNDMDGRPWHEIFAEQVPSKRIKTWESEQSSAGQPIENVASNPRDNADALQLLSDMGHNYAPSGDLQQIATRVSKNNRIYLAIALTDSNRVPQAIEHWNSLVTDYPGESSHAIQLASCYQRVDCWPECKDTLAHIPEEARQLPEVQFMLAKIALQEGETGEALRIACELAEQASENLHFLNRVGALFLQASAWEEAESVFQNSLAASKTNPIAHDGLAQVYLELDQLKTAVKHARSAVELIHHFPAAHFHLGAALHYAGHAEEAIAAFETCLSMGYELEETHSRLAGLYLLRDPAKAKHHRDLANLS
ncbi:alkaline phosphatase family protein [Bythopirellula polymerisocia]|uniref:Type I phosphodiesterase / nucleotide pyrophosphatase n=1 Tax=Bythopirellula polymerisocia TaxID=2528003 RepID=A0A5C6C8D4_9BACT|nr:alkaline phosphatase family protein [Bythopirellula polymerisocia]TWU20790.1 Type I phosphodiesterase / nucleotide pyrophosphatase [Bythopirellula polymerisocia]